ncbi:MAG: hypothetical protein ACI9TO_000470 [Rickettsiales bacterium]|jgi:hypothetical protein
MNKTQTLKKRPGPSLADIQNDFIDAIYDEKQKSILSAIKTGKAGKEDLLNIYRNNLSSNLIGALKITYPLVLNFLGEKEFNQISAEFIKDNRSTSGNLDYYGEEFFEFLLIKKNKFLSDLARLEWIKQESYLVKDAPLIDISQLQNLDSEKLFDVEFGLHPSCFLYRSKYDLLAEINPDQDQEEPVHFMINRHNLEVSVEKIPLDEFNFICGIAEKLNLYQIYEKYEIDIQKCLAKYLSNNVLISFKVA